MSNSFSIYSIFGQKHKEKSEKYGIPEIHYKGATVLPSISCIKERRCRHISHYICPDETSQNFDFMNLYPSQMVVIDEADGAHGKIPNTLE
ncbi:MAG: hypothetical protein WD512_14990, partial [Candidatus Paceibacterota bacterium]